MEGDYWAIDSAAKLEAYIEHVRAAYKDKGFIMAKVETEDARTNQQNNALHLYCSRLAKALNDAGLDKLKVLKPGAEIPWSGAAVKEDLWRPVQLAITGKKSTTEAKKAQYPEIYDALNSHLATKFGVSVEWPTKPPGMV